ncbi:hypothetical protein LC612_30505 [Nostoc sp. CHAB 5834]|nr:hypothetical protein [Nostoc sp. CHAB 5834]
MQLGFDIDYVDPVTHRMVDWALPSKPLLAEIASAPWKIVDVETTGLNPASKEQNFSSKEIRRGVDPRLRLRISSVFYPSPTGLKCVSFDFDQLEPEERVRVCDAALKNVVIAHNAGFDGYWKRLNSKIRPTLLLDSMLIARVLYPQQPILMAKLCQDDNVAPEVRDAAEMMFKAGRSGWSLADLVLTRLGIVMDKDLQGPKNWCQPFLTQASYEYATGDTVRLFHLLLSLFNLKEEDVANDPRLLLTRYEELKVQHPALTIVEPQVMDIIEMCEHGMPWDVDSADAYIIAQKAIVKAKSRELVEMEPTLASFEKDLCAFDKGVTADLKDAIGKAFTARGVQLDLTEKAGTFKIGEKDLRKVKAAISGDAKAMFETWVALNRAKKAGGMAKEVSGYALRSPDGRLHPNTGHGPVTGRLSSSEPNCQQFPRDQLFRNCVKAAEGYKIVASDYSALDMRVGAALAIRAQRQIFEAYMGDRKVDVDVKQVLERVYEGRITTEAARLLEARATTEFNNWKDKRDDVADETDARKRYWETYRKRARTLLIMGFQRCLREVRDRAEIEGTAEWGSLRDAFNIDGMDIHTWTALSMMGKDPKELFGKLQGEAVSAELKKWKKELGDRRQTGKVGNLSLLYAMKTLGLMDAAAKNYNIHWTFEEADKVRNDWLAAYVEIDLWHKWTELNPCESVYVPDPDKGMRYTKKMVYASETLGDRLIYAFGLNAALSYEDQSTGADILGRVMDTFRRQYPEIFRCAINQVHDELVFEIPDEHVDGYTETIQRVMTECAEYFLMPFGIKGECSPAVGDVWLKD